MENTSGGNICGFPVYKYTISESYEILRSVESKNRGQHWSGENSLTRHRENLVILFYMLYYVIMFLHRVIFPPIFTKFSIT